MTIALLIQLTTKVSANWKNALIDPSGHVINRVEGSEYLPSPERTRTWITLRQETSVKARTHYWTFLTSKKPHRLTRQLSQSSTSESLRVEHCSRRFVHAETRSRWTKQKGHKISRWASCRLHAWARLYSFCRRALTQFHQLSYRIWRFWEQDSGLLIRQLSY